MPLKKIKEFYLHYNILKSYTAICLICFILCLSINAEPFDYSPGILILKFSTTSESQIISFLNKSGAYSYGRVFPATKSLSNIYSLKFSPDSDILSLVQKFQKEPIVEYAQPNYLNRLCSKSSSELSDEFYEYQWALPTIDALKAWEMEKGSKDIVIAVVDTGIDYNHEDLKGRIWVNKGEIPNNGVDDDGNGYIDDVIGWDFLDKGNDPMDKNWHGTHVAGIIGAVPDNFTGVAGILWDCQIMALRAGEAYLQDDDVSAAIVYAADNGAHIINMSWGSNTFSYIILDAINYAYSRGCVLVGAAGNDDRPWAIYPALHNNVIAVGATNREDKKAYFSNYGQGIDIVAPGDRIFATTPKDKYSSWSGTSMAAPVVSAVAALMLSKRRSLTNQEVYQILRQTADKIDEPLFSGAGRVNAAKALVASVPLTASIVSPENGMGTDKGINIKGTATGSKFSKFRLEYANLKIVMDESDWRLINIQNVPVLDDLLGKWDTKNLDEGSYVVRLRVFGDGKLEAEDKIILNVDHSPPKIAQVKAVWKIQEDIYRYAITWRTDDLTFGEMYYRESNTEKEFQRITTGSISNGHTIYISDYRNPGEYEYFVKATNRAGLLSIDDNNGKYYTVVVKSLRVPLDGFTERALGIPALHPLNKNFDFNDNGLMEIIGMETKSEFETVKMYEKDFSGVYSEVFSSDKPYLLWDLDDTDGDGLYELLGSGIDSTFLYESPEPGAFPTQKIWEMNGLWGGRIADLDNDGKKEILARHLESNSIHIYENRGDNSYTRVGRLENPTEGDNYLATTFAVWDFDGDGLKEIVMGDQDGDIFIYENVDNDKYQHTWTGKLPNSQIIFANIGDFNGDGKQEFIIGARLAENYDPMKRQWIFAIFECFGDNKYEMVWSQEIIGVRKSEGGITVGDLDNDGKDEIVILVTPSLYVFKYSSPGSYEPIWYHPADNTRWHAIYDFDSDGVNDILFNEANKLKAFRWQSPALRPWGLIALPLNEREIELRWNAPADTNSYRIYRGTNKNNLRLIETFNLSDSQTTTGYFHDKNLTADVTYWYAIASVKDTGQEQRSDKVSVMPNSPPKLILAEYVPPSTIRLIFNEAMGLSAQNESLYTITSGNEFHKKPSSALLDFHGERVILTLTDSLKDGLYQVTAYNVRDATGVPISVNANTVIFQVITPIDDEWSDLSLMRVYPNPIMPNSRHPGRLTFDNLPSSTKIRIYNMESQLVRTLGEGEFNKSKIIWYLDNENRQKIASGIYIYVAECDGDKKSGKIGIVR